MDNCAPEMSFPLRHYRGISVLINLKMAAEAPPEILSESGIDILKFKEKFCHDGTCFIMRAKDEIEHIFSELYSVPECLQRPYLEVYKRQHQDNELFSVVEEGEQAVDFCFAQPVNLISVISSVLYR